MDAPRDEVDFERLSQYLKALAHPARLEILWRLRIPSSPGDVVVRPRRRDAGLPAERPMSRQAIMEHIETLEAVGVVNRAPSGDAGGRWVTSAQHVFALIEDLRRLTAIESTAKVDVDATFADGAAPPALWTAGPKLVLAGGPWEGRAFPLAGEGPWTVGRSKTRDVALTYDPFASAEHARFARTGGTFSVASEPGARNPVRVNFQPLPADKTRALAPGDVVGVGRSLLVFQPA